MSHINETTMTSPAPTESHFVACRKCGIEKLIAAFCRDLSRPSGRHPYCRACQTAAHQWQLLAKRTAPCACGCGGLAVTRFIRGHSRSRRPNPAYILDPKTGCWNWQGYTQPKDNRAGQMMENGRRASAYVIFYERAKGSVPAGLVLDHTCRNPQCVNPSHLEAVTYAVNNQRGNQAKLSSEKVAAIRIALQGGATRTALANAYGVSYATIEEIEKREAWA